MATVTVYEVGKIPIDSSTGTPTTGAVTAGASNTIQGVTNDTLICLENTSTGTIGWTIAAQVSTINVTGHGNISISNVTGTVASGATKRMVVNVPIADYASGGACTLTVDSGTAANLLITAIRPQRI